MTLLTSDHQTGLPGFFRAGDGAILDELGDYSPLEFIAAREELVLKGMLRVDPGERLVWLCNAIKAEYNIPDNPNIARSWARRLAQFERCGLVDDYLRAVLAEAERWPRGMREAFVATLQELDRQLPLLETVTPTVTPTVREGMKNTIGTTSSVPVPVPVPPEGSSSSVGCEKSPSRTGKGGRGDSSECQG